MMNEWPTWAMLAAGLVLLLAVVAWFGRLGRDLREDLVCLRQELLIELGTQARQDRVEQSQALERLAGSLSERVGQLGALQSRQLDSFAAHLARQTQRFDERSEVLRQTVDERLQQIQQDNAVRLEAMRRTVDEKLQSTLEQRLGDSFRLVSERLEQVHRGLGEMQTLAAGVGDLRKVLTNVRVRGLWGEVQLQSLLDQILQSSQYACNVATRPGCSERVEFALRLPGGGEQSQVWLPIDAKFPIESYQLLLDAQERGDAAAAEAAARALEARLRSEAQTIHDKYVEPPHTTDFAILYLPVEGLYAEALRRPGLIESLQRDLRITIAGPTTLGAMLNSLQMGFRTLAIEQRSAEVWAVLGAVKTEFGKFGEALAHTRKKLQEASHAIDKAEVRTRVMTRHLREVESLPQMLEKDDADADWSQGREQHLLNELAVDADLKS